MQELYDRLKERLPLPMAKALSAFLQEQPGFAKLNRLIDAYEVCLKLVSAVSIQSFYALGLAKEFPEADIKIRENISRASVGHWMSFLREACVGLRQRAHDVISPELLQLDLEDTCSRLGALRNKYRGHGATLSDARAAVVMEDYVGDLESLVSQCEFLAKHSLGWEQRPSTETTSSKAPPGSVPAAAAPEAMSSSGACRVFLKNEATGGRVDLYPLLVFDPAWEKTGRALFVNSWEKKRCEFLDYGTGDHVYLDAPNSLLSELEKAFPRPPSEEDPAHAERFTDLIESVTAQFVGREEELERLRAFSSGSAKRALVVIGSPGVGKTSLLAEFGKEEPSIRHYIREGDAAMAEPIKVFDNLSIQLTDTYQVEWKRPKGNSVAKYKAEFERVLGLAAQKAQAPVIVQIDGLDEADRLAKRQKGGRSSDSFLSWLPDPAAGPKNVQWIFSTRPELLDTPAFAANLQADKAEHLHLCGLPADAVRALLLQVCRWQEIIVAGDKVEKIVELSEGSPLYLTLLLQDLAVRRLTLDDIDKLPVGVTAYFNRILEALQRENEALEGAGSEAILGGKIELLKTLLAKHQITREQFQDFVREAKEQPTETAEAGPLELLAVFAVAREPMLLTDAAAALGKVEAHSNRAFQAVRTVLVEQREDQFAVFHGAFTEFLREHKSQLLQTATTRLIEWCLKFGHHHRPYAIRNVSAHLIERLRKSTDIEDSKLPLQQLEHVLTDLNYISLKLKTMALTTLVEDYDQALELWPNQVASLHAQNNPNSAFDDSAVRNCTVAVLNGALPGNLVCPSSTTLQSLKGRSGQENYANTLGLLHGPGFIDRIPDKSTAPSDWFGPGEPTPATVAEIGKAGIELTTSGTSSSPYERVREFATFVRTWLPANTVGELDVVALAYNQATSGAVADKAALLLSTRQVPWIRRSIRPAAPQSEPLVLQSYAGYGEVGISPDFRHVIMDKTDPKARAQGLKLVDALTGVPEKEITAGGKANVRLPDHMLVSKNGEIVLLGGSVWSLKQDKLLCEIDPPTRAVAMSADGRVAVTAEYDNELKVWDLIHGKLCRTIDCDDKEVHSLSLSGDGLILAVACHAEQLRLYDVNSGDGLLTFMTGHHVLSVALTPDSKFVVFGGRDGIVRVLYLPEVTLAAEFTHDQPVHAVAISSNGRVVVTADWSSIVRVWDVSRATLSRTIHCHVPIQRISLSQDGSLLFAGGSIWDIKRGKASAQLRSKTHRGSAIISTNQSLIALGTTNVSAELWHAEESGLRELATSPSPLPHLDSEVELKCKAIAAKGTAILVALSDGSLAVWDSVTGVAENRIDAAFIANLKESEMPDVQRRVNAVKFKHLDTELQAMLKAEALDREYTVAVAAFSPDGGRLATAVYGESVRIWDTRTGRCTHSLPIHVKERIAQGEVVALEFFGSDDKLAFVTSEAEVHIWNYHTGAHRSTAPGDSVDFYQQLAVCPNSNIAVRYAAQLTRRLEIWDLENLTLIRSLRPPAYGLGRMSLSSDGTALVCAAKDYEHAPFLAAFDLNAAELIATYPTRTPVTALSKLVDDGRIVCATADGEIHILQIEKFSSATA